MVSYVFVISNLLEFPFNFFHIAENGMKQKTTKINPAELIAGQVTVQSEKESALSKKLRKLEKKDKSKYSTTEIKQ